MEDKLEIFFNDTRFDSLKPKDTPEFYWTARFKKKGITAYGASIEIASAKAMKMLQYKNELDNKKPA